MIALVGSVTSLAGNDVTSLTWAHTGSPGACLIVAVGGESAAGDISGVTYGGVAMTQAAKKLSFQMGFVYYLRGQDVPTGSNNVVVTFTNAAKAVGFALNYSGVGNFRTASAGATGAASPATSPAMTTVIGDMCIFIEGDRDEAADHAAGGGATERGDVNGGAVRGFVSELMATGTSTSMSCSWAGTDVWACTAVPLVPAPTGNQVIWL